MLPRAGGIINYVIPDITVLHASYMPFVQGGALFIPSSKNYEMGDEAVVVVTLPGATERVPVTGKVVWINHRSHGTRPSGFGVRLQGEEGKQLQAMIEKMLAGQIPADRQTYTM